MGQRFVYILRSDSKPDAPYIGVTSDVSKRLWWHNNGPDGYTRRHRPWRLVVAVECEDEAVARRFERYLKSGSGQNPRRQQASIAILLAFVAVFSMLRARRRDRQ
jgi:predicted GIY-YIG superfamily endonuclease